MSAAMLVLFLQPASQVIQQSHYKVLKDTKFQGTTEDSLTLSSRRLGGPVACASACSLQDSCTSVTYDPALKTCMRNLRDIYTFGHHNLTSSKHVHYMGKVQADITDGDWTLVFRGQASNGLPMGKVFSNSSYRSDHNMADMNPAHSSTYPDVTLPHFRSRWMDLWPSDAIDLVKVQLYKNGRAEVNLTFNGTGSNNTNWFSMTRLLDASPYTDLRTNVSISIFSSRVNRMFVISNTSDVFSCSQQAWLIVDDQPSNLCYWSSMLHSPRILYSAFNHLVDFNNRSPLHREADILAVFVKFQERY
ncbi:hypothetical protein BsWGS_07866 [Bradybaena similaris]